ncbi:MAG: DUF3616 domain-containing protein [Pseudonocardiaceae bacterium]
MDIEQLALRFAQHALDTQTHVNLSAVRPDGTCLWIAGDETATVERLTADRGGYGKHTTFHLADALTLPGGPEDEVDIEGLARYGPYLWAVGSHSSRRKQIKAKHEDDKAIRRLAQVSDEPSRRVLARLAVTDGPDGLSTIMRETPDGHTSALLPGGVTGLLTDDPHLSPFLTIPGKDNGLDVEGVAVHGELLYLGLRGPVLRGWAVVIALLPQSGKAADELEPAALDGDGAVYRTHFLELDGLGVRDLCPDGADLLVLAGPSMDLDGPVRVYRWLDAFEDDVPRVVRAPALRRELDLPFGEGDDHPEGIGLLDERRLLVVYDSPAPARLATSGTVLADVITL